MEGKLTVEQLQRAAGDLGRLESFFRQRAHWYAAPAAAAALSSADTAAARLTAVLEPRLHAIEGPPPRDPDPIVDPLPAADLEPQRLEKMADFLVDLAEWFAVHTSSQVESGGEQHLEAASRSLRGIRDSLSSILAHARGPADPEEAGPAVEAPMAADPAPPHHGGPSGQREVVRTPPPEPRPANVITRSERLVLEDTEQAPLLQTLKDQTELTPQARELLTDFLERNGLVYSGYQGSKFEAEVGHRLEILPPGQVLVIKIGEYGGEPKPFFSYVSKNQDGPS